MPTYLELSHAPLRINARGEWLHGDEPLDLKIARLFAKHVAVNAQGHYVVQMGYDVQPLQVVDTPYWAHAVTETLQSAKLSGVTFTASDGVVETLDFATLMQSSDHVLYCRIVRHGFSVACRFSARHYHQLGLYGELSDKTLVFEVRGVRYAVQPFAPAPQPLTTLRGQRN